MLSVLGLAADSVGSDEIAAGAVDTDELAADAVTGAKLDTRKETRIGSTSATWALSATPYDDDHLQLYKNGLLLTEGATEDYTRSGTTVTLAEAPETADRVTAIYQV